MKNTKYASLLSTLLFFAGICQPIDAQANSCAVFHLQNESFDTEKGAAEECHALAASFDLSTCPETSAAAPVQMSCNGDDAVASVKTKTTHYEVALKRYRGSKGNVLWDAEGGVKERPLESKHSKKKKQTQVAARASHANRAPAEVRHLDEKKQTEIAQQKAEPLTAVPSPKPSPVATPEATPTPTPTPTSTTAAPKISGMFDMYYAQNFNRPSAVALPTNANPGIPAPQNQYRNFDLYSNQFALNFAELTVKNTDHEIGYLVDLDFGEEADYMARLSSVGSDTITNHIGQAILTYSPDAAPKLSFAIGKMATNMGYETPKALNNWQYSRSFLFSEGLPYWHVGASATYNVVPGFFTGTAYVYNGWNTLYSTNSGKTYALQFTLTPNDALSFTYNGIGGPEQPNDNTDLTTVQELVATWNASEKLQFAWDTIGGWAGRGFEALGTASWQAASLAAKYQVNAWYSISPRVEYYRDPEGYTTGTAQNLSSFTLTNAFKAAKGLEPRVEFRWDHSTQASFQSNTGATQNQASIAFAILYGF